MLFNSTLKTYTYISLAVFIGLLTYVYINVPNIPTADEWELSYFVEKIYNKSFVISDLMVPHNECRMPYPHIIHLIILFITRWHSFSLIAFNLTLLLVFYFTLRKYTFESLNPKRINAFGVSFILILLVIFSLKQYENIVLSFDLNYYLSVIAGLWSFISLKKISWKSVTVSMIWAHISLYSYASGFTIWPFLILLIWIISEEGNKAKVIYSLVVATVFVCNIVLYFYNYHPLANAEAEKSTNPVELIPYALTFLSNNFVTTGSTAIKLTIVQLIVIVSAIWVLFKTDKVKALQLSPIFAYGFWAISIGFMVAHGRASLGIMHALSPRYCTLSFPFAICSIISLIIHIEYIGYWIKIKVINRYVTLQTYMLVAIFGVQQVRYLKAANLRNNNLAEAVKHIKASDFDAPIVKEMLYNRSDILKIKVDMMKKHHLSLYR